MGKKKPIERFKSDPISHLVGLFATLSGLAFFAMQTSKFFRPGAAEEEMMDMPFGLYDWGYVWADSTVLGPILLIGGILLLGWCLSRPGKIGHLLVFTGFALNLYIVVAAFIGYHYSGAHMPGSEWAINIPFTILGILCMIWSAIRIAKGPLAES